MKYKCYAGSEYPFKKQMLQDSLFLTKKAGLLLKRQLLPVVLAPEVLILKQQLLVMQPTYCIFTYQLSYNSNSIRHWKKNLKNQYTISKHCLMKTSINMALISLALLNN